MRPKGLELDPPSPARAAAALAALFALVSLMGWALGMHGLASVLPQAVAMKVNTATCLLACAMALAVLAGRPGPAMRRLAQALALGAALVGLATLIEYFAGWNLHIDELVVKDRIQAYNIFPGRMSPFSAATFIAIGCALAAMPVASLRDLAKGGALVTIGTSAVSLLGYLWGAGELVTDAWLPPIAVNTATCFLLLGGGILLSPRSSAAGLGSRIATLPAVEARTLVGFLLAFALLLVGGGYTYRGTVQFASSVEWVSHSQEIRAALAGISGSLGGAELAERDYFLAPDAARLGEYWRLVGEVESQAASLARLTANDPVQSRNFEALKATVDKRLKIIADGLEAFQNTGLASARAVLAHTRGTNDLRQVRAEVDRMDGIEVKSLADKQAASAGVRHATLISLLVTLFVASGVFAVLFGSIQREMRARREVEHALRASELYNRGIVDSSPDCLALLTLDARVAEMTSQGRVLMEIDDFSAVAGSDWLGLWKGDEHAAARAALEAARRGGTGRFQGQCPTHKGRSRWWDVIVRPILGAEGHPERLLAVSRDITEVKRAEGELVETNRFLDSLIENLPVMVVLKDARNLSFVRHNRVFERLIGFSREQLAGRTAHELFAPEEADFMVAKDREALEANRLVEIPEQTIVTPHLGARVFQTMKTPVGGKDGRPEYILTIGVDITERKLAERAVHELNHALEHQAEQLRATNKELESFSYSVSHDLRAPLRAIDGFAMMLQEDCAAQLDAEGNRYLSVIRENSRRMGALIDDLLAFSRLGRLPVSTREVNVESLVREVVEDALHDHAGERPRIDIGPLPSVQADPVLLRQVWTNLVSNAIKYSSKAAAPSIEIRGECRAGENCYAVRDNGVGFNMDYVDKLFGVFQRLHRADEFSGTGVGLAIVQRVVTRHGGRVWARGKVDEGAEFSFALPA
jgi:PAS domain S-box-containing protein